MKLLIASPPCQAWSMAGKREGIRDQARVFDLARAWANDPRAPRPHDWYDERSPLAAEPMRWAASLRPDLMAWEQVPPVLDLWEHCADLLRPMGYSVWTGILSAERYGVPQTRKRAILLASRVGQVHPPHPTHQAYVAGEPPRHDVTLEGEILPWVSMAEALGWTVGERGFDRRQGNTMADESRHPVPIRPDSEPAPTIDGVGMAKGRNDVPAPTVTGGGTDADDPEVFGRGGRERIKRAMLMGDRVQPGCGNKPRPADEPSATLGTRTDLAEWTEERPATTVQGDPRIAEPGWRGKPEDYDAEGNYHGTSQGTNAVRVTVEEASILQSFDPAYPWQGSRSAQFQQIGNAVPPLLARAILAALTEGVEVGSDCIDLFAGPGGWDVGARALGIDPLGIEYDDNACATREAAGLRTLQGDVSALDPSTFTQREQAA